MSESDVVVPAHAGVIQPVGAHPRARACRPRTRGGHPPAPPTAAATPRSSPHTRGSSSTARAHRGAGVVVPAHAGVIRHGGGNLGHPSCRPRTRGGHPGVPGTTRKLRVSSPHTRGSSDGAAPLRGRRGVVPAHAGVIRPGGSRWRRAPCRSRTRGGHPAAHSAYMAERRSSPHTRGSSPDLSGSTGGRLVVPAYAGVIPAPGGRRSGCGSRPRTRGGHPGTGVVICDACWSSPHTRGSSARRLRAVSCCRVVPAHAGVIPSSASTR